MISQMMIAIIIDDTPEFVIKGELERNKLFQLYKKREHQVLHTSGHEEVVDGVDVQLARSKLHDILSGAERVTSKDSTKSS